MYSVQCTLYAVQGEQMKNWGINSPGKKERRRKERVYKSCIVKRTSDLLTRLTLPFLSLRLNIRSVLHPVVLQLYPSCPPPCCPPTILFLTHDNREKS